MGKSVLYYLLSVLKQILGNFFLGLMMCMINYESLKKEKY